MIRKLERPDYSKPKAYRIPSLINCISKVIDKVVMVRTTRWLEETAKLHKRQMKFRGKRSTMDALIQIIYRIQQTWKQKQYMLLLMIEIKVVFLPVSKNRLVNKTKKLKISNYLIALTQS